MISIIYPYRNRAVKSVKKSLESLVLQTNKKFEVYFVNYGSDEKHSTEIEALLENFPFVHYHFLYTQQQPWNKSKALNSVIKTLETDRFFVADVDMIFHPNFINITTQLAVNKVWYFQVGFLSEEETNKTHTFENYNIKFASTFEATGLTLCSVKWAKEIMGFDEFYHFWGSEDTDFHVRLKHAGYNVSFYNETILLLHQWHDTYRLKEKLSLTKELQMSGIVQFNHHYLKRITEKKNTLANSENWGQIQTEQDYKNLLAAANNSAMVIGNACLDIDYFLFQELPNLNIGIHAFKFIEINGFESLKKRIKNKIRKNKTSYYTLKEVNDKLLFHSINFYRDCPYNYKVSQDLKSITFTIHKK